MISDKEGSDFCKELLFSIYLLLFFKKMGLQTTSSINEETDQLNRMLISSPYDETTHSVLLQYFNHCCSISN